MIKDMAMPPVWFVALLKRAWSHPTESVGDAAAVLVAAVVAVNAGVAVNVAVAVGLGGVVGASVPGAIITGIGVLNSGVVVLAGGVLQALTIAANSRENR
jgi:hypothetical protein